MGVEVKVKEEKKNPENWKRPRDRIERTRKKKPVFWAPIEIRVVFSPQKGLFRKVEPQTIKNKKMVGYK